MSAEKVIHLPKSKLFEDIQNWFSELETHNEGTRKSFEARAREFFRFLRDKELEFINEEDIKINRQDIKNFRKFLLGKGNKNSTVNQKLASVKCLFVELKANEYDINVEAFKLKRLKEVENSYGELTLTKAKEFEDLALHERNKPIIKNRLIGFGIRTSFRIDEILNLKWSDFEFSNGIYKVHVVGKGTKDNHNSIHQKFYNTLLDIKTDSEFVFDISYKTVCSMMNRMCEKLNIDPSENISFHSFRNVAANFDYDINKDIKRVAQQLNHSNVNTSYRHYMHKKRDFTQTPGVIMDQELDWSFMEELSLEDFKEFFKNGEYKLYNDLKKFTETLKDKKQINQ